MTFGMRLYKNRTLFIFENSTEFYNKISNNIYNDVNKFKIAFEHKFRIGPSIRMGLSYEEALLKKLNPLAKITLGSNKNFINNKLNIDFGLIYYITNYKYEDIFPTQYSFIGNDCSDTCDKVIESNLSLITTFKWSF